MDELEQLLANVPANKRDAVRQWYQVEMDNGVAAPDLLQSIRAKYPTPRPGVIAGTTEAFGRGAGFGLTDEAAGALGALEKLWNPGKTPQGGFNNPLTAAADTYRTERDFARQRQDQFSQDHPVLNAGGQILGGLATGIATAGSTAPLAPGALAPTAGQLGIQGAKIALPYAAATTLGENRDLGTLPQELAVNLPVAALGGGILGAATPTVARGVSGLWRYGRNFFAPQSAAASEALQRLGLSLPANAEAQLARANAASGGRAMVGDLNPELLTAATLQHPEARPNVLANLAERSAGGGSRLAGDITEATTGLRTISMPEARDAIRTGKILPSGEPSNRMREELSQRLYAPLEQEYAVLPMTPEVADVMTTVGTDTRLVPMYKRAQTRVAPGTDLLRGRSGPPSFKVLQETLREAKEEIGRVRGTAEFQPLSEAVRRLEDQMNLAFPGDPSRNIPSFQQAQAGYEQGMGMLRGFAKSKGAFSLTPDDLSRRLAAMSETEADAYRMGALWRYADRLQNLAPGRNAGLVATQRGGQSLEPHLKALFGDTEQLSRYLQRAEAEGMFARTSQATRAGSPTEPLRQANVNLFGNENATGPNPLTSFWRAFQRDAVTMPPRALAEQYVPALTAAGKAGERVVGQARQAAVAARNTPRVPGFPTRQVADVLPRFAGTPGADEAAKAALLAWILGHERSPRLRGNE